MAKSFINNYNVSLGLRNNNPGNLVPTGENWQGLIGTNEGFMVFQDISFGIRALGLDLKNEINRGLNTIESLITNYAPPSENDTQGYIDFVSNYTGIGPYQILTANADTLQKLCSAIIIQENGQASANLITQDDISEGLALVPGIVSTGNTSQASGGIFFLLIALGFLFSKK